MAFGLKNARATYQWMVNKVFSTQIGRNMEIYVDDMIIKIWEAVDHEANLRESFDNLQSLPFFKATKKEKEIKWTPECEASFQELKAYLQSPWLLARPVTEDILQLYLAVSESALNSVLIREEEKAKCAFGGGRHGPTSAEFLENPIWSRRIVKWAIELSEFDLRYKPRMSIKAHVLADFMEEGRASVNVIKASREKVWLLYVDGASNPGGSGAWILL
ncbi:hypothetical protein LIER_13825 [Lithospermum erythrorhizon]|uniref:Uncharacterized protein n=1 Tax=Lithospermum erythrorhizon TaxID=34254 RepID=A0AAV3PWX9_LITER